VTLRSSGPHRGQGPSPAWLEPEPVVRRGTLRTPAPHDDPTDAAPGRSGPDQVEEHHVQADVAVLGVVVRAGDRRQDLEAE